MEKYGFVYIWFDRKHFRYYIGCHWGHEKDGYICSSNWMRDAYKRRPEDFKRRVVTKIKTKEELYIEEFRWLSMIKDEELRIRYYNLRKWSASDWTLNEDYRTARQKISDTHKGKNKIFTEEHIKNMCKPKSKEHKENIRKANIGKHHSSKTKEKIAKLKSNGWIVISPDGKIYVISNMCKFCRENNLDNSHMIKTAHGKQKSCKGWQVFLTTRRRI